MPSQTDPSASSRRRELQTSEAVRFESRRGRLQEERTGTSNLTNFDAALLFLDRSWEASPVDEDSQGRTPLHVLTAAALAMAALYDRPIPVLPGEDLRALSVQRYFRRLVDALIEVVDDPSPDQCAKVLTAYRRSVTLPDYRAALARGLWMTTLLAVSTVARRGNVIDGALYMFD